MIMEQKLEETLEELLRATEAQSSLRNRCSCLEEKQKQKEEQTEVAHSVVILTSNIKKKYVKKMAAHHLLGY